MTMQDAFAQQPMWVQYWLYGLTFGAAILPLLLFIWRQTRLAAILTLAANAGAAISVTWLFDQLGYVKLLGLPHIILWTPLAWYLYTLICRDDMPAWPRRIMWIALATLLVSLAFDTTDVARYIMGERMAFGQTA